MQMGSTGTARVAAPRHYFTRLDRDLARIERQIDLETLQLILLGFQVRGDLRIITLQMAIDRRGAIGVCQIERIAIAPRADRDSSHIARLHRMHWFTLGSLRLEVDARMEMVAAQLAEVPTQQQGEIKRIAQSLRPYREGTEAPQPDQPTQSCIISILHSAVFSFSAGKCK